MPRSSYYTAGITSDKVPTELAYNAPAQSSTPNHAIKWGFQFKPEETRLRCIKLFLDRNQKLPHFVSPLETAAQLRKYEKTVMEAVSDYLSQIYKHTMETLTRRYGETFMGITKVQFVLTVPAVWSDSAKDATLKAAEKAGMGNRHELKLISEPEAAAVYTLKAIQPNHLKVGDNFIVCDAGKIGPACQSSNLTRYRRRHRRFDCIQDYPAPSASCRGISCWYRRPMWIGFSELPLRRTCQASHWR